MISCSCSSRNGATKVAEYDVTLTYGCNVVAWFWVTWLTDGLLTVGQGSVVGQRAMFNYKDSSPFAINYLAVSSGVASSQSIWTVPAEFFSSGIMMAARIYIELSVLYNFVITLNKSLFGKCRSQTSEDFFGIMIVACILFRLSILSRLLDGSLRNLGFLR